MEGYPKLPILIKSNGHRYEVTFKPISRELEPVNFDYSKLLEKEVKKLEKNGHRSVYFDVVAEMEYPPELTEDVLSIRFIMPSTLNLIIKLNFDRKKMDLKELKGRMGLRFECRIERIKNLDPVL